ncbi:hypothetical protein GMO17_27125 (plasmid) [Pseudomonas coronafaciens pv. coronafaciens]|uniref:Uncharacterized protein n=1 Tax=Pseudomonas coronafaciens pv. coronafaciens TaxID=235275 RepID=A0AAE6QLL5_9PSED|nr:hypothetical protein GMO17_27125 [Pseudomonas coronafaciens pv. coronafaciens]
MVWEGVVYGWKNELRDPESERPGAYAVDKADNELDALRRDAERYRVLRENWLRIEQGSTVHRAGGLDLWCDERLPDSDQ